MDYLVLWEKFGLEWAFFTLIEDLINLVRPDNILSLIRIIINEVGLLVYIQKRADATVPFTIIDKMTSPVFFGFSSKRHRNCFFNAERKYFFFSQDSRNHPGDAIPIEYL